MIAVGGVSVYLQGPVSRASTNTGAGSLSVSSPNVGSQRTGSVSRLGDIGGAVHPVGNGNPGSFGYRLNEIVQAFVLADGDGEAGIHPAADGDHGVGIEAAVGPHRELSPGPTAANPPHRLTQEMGGASGGVGPALAQAGQQHVAGAGGDGQQRVIAPCTGVAVVAGALLGQSVSLADGRVQVDMEQRIQDAIARVWEG